MKPIISSHSIPSTIVAAAGAGAGAGAGAAIDAHVFEPSESTGGPIRGTIVTVHPWSALGGGEHNTIGLARQIITTRQNSIRSKLRKQQEGGDLGLGAGGSSSSSSSWRVVTFALKSNSFWRGGPIGGILTNHSYEVQQIVDVVHWVQQKYGMMLAGSNNNIVVLGSSAGAPMAGTAVARLNEDQQHGYTIVSAYIAVGYTLGKLASLGFGRHFSSLLSSSTSSSTSSTTTTVPKLFIMGERDEFTSVDQLNDMAQQMMRANNNGNGGNVVDVEIVPDVGHFELESPRYDPLVAKMVLDWLDRTLQ